MMACKQKKDTINTITSITQKWEPNHVLIRGHQYCSHNFVELQYSAIPYDDRVICGQFVRPIGTGNFIAEFRDFYLCTQCGEKRLHIYMGRI